MARGRRGEVPGWSDAAAEDRKQLRSVREGRRRSDQSEAPPVDATQSDTTMGCGYKSSQSVMNQLQIVPINNHCKGGWVARNDDRSEAHLLH